MSKELLSGIESLIHSGQTNKAKYHLRLIGPSGMNPDFHLFFADLCLMSNLPQLALRTLFAMKTESNTEIHAVLGTALFALGATDDAISRFPQSSWEKFPWHGMSAAHFLKDTNTVKKLLEVVDTSKLGYWKRIDFYLTASESLLFSGESSQSHEILQSIKSEIDEQENPTFAAKWMELFLFNLALDGKFVQQKSLALFPKGLQELEKSWPETSAFFQLVNNWAESGYSSKEAIDAAKTLTEKSEKWEYLRLLDLVYLQKTGSALTASKLFIGTPSKHLQGEISKLVRSPRLLESDVMWPTENNATERILDLSTGMISQSAISLKPGQLLHRIVVALLSDLYAPVAVARIHEIAYPGEKYDPNISPARIHEAVKRFRQWCRESQLPLSVVEHGSSYRIVVSGEISVRLHSPIHNDQLAPPQIERLRRQIGKKTFSIRDASDALSISSRGALRVVTHAIELGLLEKQGRSRAVRYQFRLQ